MEDIIMLKEKEINKVMMLQRASGDLRQIEQAIIDEAYNKGIPLETKFDQVKRGGMFSNSLSDCLIIYHAQHKNDYYKIVLVDEGNIGVYSFGESKNQKKLNNRAIGKNVISDSIKQANRNASEGKSVGIGLTMGVLAGGLRALSGLGANKKSQTEELYYEQIMDLINNL